MSTLGPTDDYTFAGIVRFRQTPKFPDDAIPSAAIDGPIAASKLEGEYSHTLSQTGTVAAATQYLRVVHGTEGTLISIEAAITEALPSGDHAVTIDLLKSTGAGAFASVLSAAIVLDSSSVLRTVVDTTFASAGLVAGDLLKLTVAVSGASGSQGAGLVATVILNEDAS